MGAFLWVEVPP